MEKDEIVNGTDGPTLATWINRFIWQYGRQPTRMSDLAAFVEEQQGQEASGHIARHDPERMARAQRAGELVEKFSQYSHMAFGISDSDAAFILGILAAVRDGKA